MYKIKYSTKFKKDIKKLNDNDKEKLKEIIKFLQFGKNLDIKYKNHELKGKYKGFMECHVKPDLLLIYKINDNELILYLLRVGNHNELF